MNQNLTIQEALEKLLVEKKSLLTDSNALMTALQENVASVHAMQLAFFRNALVDVNIGEVLMLADELGKDARDRAETEAIVRLEKNNMPKERAVFVVQTLTEAMGWNRESPPPPPSSSDNGRESIPIIEVPQQDTQIQESEPVKTPPEIIIKHDKTAVDYYNGGFSALSEKKYDKALEGFNKAIDLNPNYVAAYFKRGLTYYSKGDCNHAIADYTKVIELNPSDADAYNIRGTIYHIKGDYDLAIADYTKVIELNPSDADAYNIRGLTYSEKGNFDRAIDDFTKALALSPTHELARKNLQMVYDNVWHENGFKDMFFKFSGRLNRKRYIIRALPIWAIGIFINLILSEPEFSENFTTGFYLLIIFLSVAIGISHLSLLTRRLRDLDMSPWWVLVMFVPIVNVLTLAYFILYKKGTIGFNKYGPDPLGNTYNNNPDSNRNSIIKKPKKIIAWVVAGVILVSLGVVASIQNDRSLAHKYNESGLVYLNKKQYEKALEEFDQSIKLYPSYAEAYYNRGEVYYEKDEYEKALSDFDKAIELDLTYTKIIKSNEDYLEAYLDCGEDYYEKDEYDKALVYLDRAIELNPQYAEAYHIRGKVYNEKQEYDKALVDLNKAIEMDSPHEYMYFERGQTYLNKGDYDRAIADFTKTIELNQKYAVAYFYRGKAYYEKKEYDKVMIDFDRAIELDSFWAMAIDQYPNCESAYYKRGIGYMKAENYDRAIADFTKVIKMNPNNVNAYFNRALMYENGKGDHDQAIADYNKIIALQPNNAAAYNNRGVSYARKGNKTQAINDYRKATEIDPNKELYRNNLQNNLR